MVRFGKKDRPFHSCAGSAAVLVVTRTVGAYWDNALVAETVLPALEHFGVPYRVLDIASEPLTREHLASCACVLLAQSRLGIFLSEREQGMLAEAVESGLGLVNLDEDLRNYGAAYRALFGFDNINPHPYVSSVLRIKHSAHFITGLQTHGEVHTFDRMVTAVAVGRWGANTQCLAECVLGKEQLVYVRHLAPWSAYEPRNYPSLFAAHCKKGRAVQFTISPRVWKKEFFGLVRGIDDLLYRSVVWAARKPFMTNVIPPFLTMSFDDCSGRHGLRYVDVATEHGYIPLPSLFLDELDEACHEKIRRDQASGRVEYNTHAFRYYDQLYHAYGRGRHDEKTLDEHFAREDAFWEKVGVSPCRTVRMHCGEMGVNALPYLKRRGRTYLNPALQTGLLKAEMCMTDGYHPYGLHSCYYDELPDDRDFFVFFSSLGRFAEDFLSGCTVNLMESPGNDLHKAADSLVKNLLFALRAGFYAEILTHEQKFENLSPDEWDTILTEADKRIKQYPVIQSGHDAIGDYLKARDGMFIGRVDVEGGSLSYTLFGSASAELLFSVYENADDGVSHAYRRVPVFCGEYSVGSGRAAAHLERSHV